MKLSRTDIPNVLAVCVWLTCIAKIAECRAPIRCEEAVKHCVSRMGCEAALNTYHISCNEVTIGAKDYCTTPCKEALISLLSTEDGEGERFIDCDCENNTICQQAHERIRICKEKVERLMESIDDEYTIINCSLARGICEADTSCQNAFNFYEENCARLWQGKDCPQKCNNSLGVLYRQEKAKKLKTCHCDDNEQEKMRFGYTCHEIKYYTHTLCFNEEYKIPTKNSPGYSTLHSTVNSASSVTTYMYLLIFSLFFMENIFVS